MGWYDDEEDSWLPDWAVTPMMWIGCLMAAAIPAGLGVATWTLLWSQPPLGAALGAYVLCLGLMVAAVKPWTVR